MKYQDLFSPENEKKKKKNRKKKEFRLLQILLGALRVNTSISGISKSGLYIAGVVFMQWAYCLCPSLLYDERWIV